MKYRRLPLSSGLNSSQKTDEFDTSLEDQCLVEYIQTVYNLLKYICEIISRVNTSYEGDYNFLGLIYDRKE